MDVHDPYGPKRQGHTFRGGFHKEMYESVNNSEKGLKITGQHAVSSRGKLSER